MADGVCCVRVNDERKERWWIEAIETAFDFIGEFGSYFAADIISFLLSSLLEIFSGP
jgi:hypothetical protein